MFEKSLYDLIKGLRQHKGNEKDFIDHNLRECRKEIKGADMDVKATALLKLIYLEMFGYDMSWASFNILEVMSSSRQHQKRIGYLGAMQTFGPGTDVLMLAINLLKKDVTSPSIPNIALPLVTVPHLATPGLASALVPDLLTRMGHSSPNVRKKSIVTLYRLALVWPEALRPAWPKMKDILENDDEDPSVTSTVVNVVCELVWRRPQDFLPLAPRFFELLISGGNNWMAIKLIKLFANLTPLEPRLVKKLAPALANLMNTTTAMSVLYECINGITHGGILDDTQGIREGDEIAELCVEKLCGMIARDGDPNLKYVSLLAFNRIVLSHPQLVSAQQNIIATCLDDGDISIRLQALSLVSKMVDHDTIIPVVGKILQQLEARNSSEQLTSLELNDPRGSGGSLVSVDDRDYDTKLIRAVLEMCSRNLYGSIADFDWYIDVLVHLVRLAPETSTNSMASQINGMMLFDEIGLELRNVAVRVKSARAHATEAASALLSTIPRPGPTNSATLGSNSVLEYAAFIVGEYPGLLQDVSKTLDVILLRAGLEHIPRVAVSLLQTIPKLLCFVFTSELQHWDIQKHIHTELLLARVTSTAGSYTSHSNIEVQEHAATLFELNRIAEAALSKHPREELMAPALIRHILPSLFVGQDLNPVAVSAQHKIPSPPSLDLQMPINESLSHILLQATKGKGPWPRSDINHFYHDRENLSMGPYIRAVTDDSSPRIAPLDQQSVQRDLDDQEKIRRQNRNRAGEPYDPFNISKPPQNAIDVSNPVHDIIQDSNGGSIDIDSIPIMQLNLGSDEADEAYEADGANFRAEGKEKDPKATTKNRPTIIVADETFIGEDDVALTAAPQATRMPRPQKFSTRALLQVDSSNIGSFTPSASFGGSHHDTNQETHHLAAFSTQDSDAAMQKALREVERIRLEMQREQDRVAIADDIPQDGTLVAKKKKKKRQKGQERSRTLDKA